MHPARGQPLVNAGQLHHRRRDRGVLAPQVARRRVAQHHDRQRCTRQESRSVVAHVGHAGHQRGVVDHQQARRARVAGRGGREGFGEDAVHDLAGNRPVGEFAHRTAFCDQFLEFHNLLRFRTVLAKIVKKNYL